jgi:hypothetical protein
VEVLAEARLLPGFEDLLQNASFGSLAQAAQQHPIVVFVAGESSGHAIIILENAQCTSVILEQASNAMLRALSTRIEHSSYVRASRGIRKVQGTTVRSTEVCQELWTSVMLPIVSVLGWPVSNSPIYMGCKCLYPCREHRDEVDVG